MAGTINEEVIAFALKAMNLLKPSDAFNAQLLPRETQGQAYKVRVDDRYLLVRSQDKASSATAHLYAKTASGLVPGFGPHVLGHDIQSGILVEEWFGPGEYKSLAQELLQEEANIAWSTPFRDGEFSQIDYESVLYQAGAKIGKVHTGTRGFVPSASEADLLTQNTRMQETYLRSARAFPLLANRLYRLAEESARTEHVLLHGCLSPASVLFSQEQVLIVSSNQSRLGDPAFDLANMMAHLFAVSISRSSSLLVTAAGAFHAGYARQASGLDKLSIMHRAGPLCAAIMLCLIDDEEAGPHFSPEDKDLIVDFSQWWLGRRDYTLGQVRYALWDAVDSGVIDWRKTFQSLPRASE